ncbi:MAG: phosphohydrolase [Saprospiraceae bacterium]|nr:phosphohydrolase [Saprospiraceae bacterium]
MKFADVKKMMLRKMRKELPNHLTYHSVHHTEDVLKASIRIARSESIKGDDLTLIKTAAVFHDSGFIFGPKDHEERSCDIARRYLPDYDYSPMQIEKICGMIMATKIPQKPRNHYEAVLSDADLDYLGRDDFFTIGNTLYQEMIYFGFIKNEDEWNNIQIRFFENHHYFTKTAIESRQAAKEIHLHMIKAAFHHKKAL